MTLPAKSPSSCSSSSIDEYAASSETVKVEHKEETKEKIKEVIEEEKETPDQEEIKKGAEEEVEGGIKEKMEEQKKLADLRNKGIKVTDGNTHEDTEVETAEAVQKKNSDGIIFNWVSMRKTHQNILRSILSTALSMTGKIALSYPMSFFHADSSSAADLQLLHIQQRDWSAIPPEIISRKVGYIGDFVHFRGVCKNWYSNSPIANLGPQFPWLVKQRNQPYGAIISLYSLAVEKEHSIEVPEASAKAFFGSVNGYLVAQTRQITVDSPNQARSQLTLINPLINHVVQLPNSNLEDFSPVQTKVGDCYIIQFGPMHKSIHALPLNRVMEYNWKEIPVGEWNLSLRHFCLGQILITVNKESGVTRVTDITTGKVECEFQGFVQQEGTEHLVMISNDIIRFFRDIDGAIHLHRLDMISKSWLMVETIGRKALFVDHVSCYVLQAFAGCGIEENTVYYLEPEYDLRIFNLETNSRSSYRLPWQEPVCWYIPNINQLQA